MHVYYVSIGNKTVLVECGVFSRLVTFTASGDDFGSLHDAIVKTFGFSGLEAKDIALLQIKSAEEFYRGHFVDIVDPSTKIEHSSVVRVVLHSRVKAVPSLFNGLVYQVLNYVIVPCLNKRNHQQVVFRNIFSNNRGGKSF